MRALQFDTHTDEFYSLATIQVGYPLLKIKKLINLKCHIICAIDKAANLHFIEHRQQLPTDPTIYPPSYASTDHPNILFSIDLLSITKQTYDKPMNEKDLKKFFDEFEFAENYESHACTLKPGVLLLRPPFELGPVYLIDLTIQNAKPKIIHEFGLAWSIIGWDDDIVIFSNYHLQVCLLYSFELQKTKKLNFTFYHADSLKTASESKLCVALSNDMLEVLDLKRNCVIERFMFDGTFRNMIAVSPKGSKLAHFYTRTENFEKIAYLNLWDVDTDKNIIKREPLRLDDLAKDYTCIEFLNEEILICARLWVLNLYQVKDYGIIKVHTLNIPHDVGYLKKIKYRHRSDLELLRLNPNNFLLMISDGQQNGYCRIESYEFNPIRPTPIVTSTSQRSADVNMNMSSLSTNRFSQIASIQSEMRMSLLFEEEVETVIAISKWKTEKLGILCSSYKLYEYDLRSGNLKKRVVLREVKRPENVKMHIKYFDRDRLVIYSGNFVMVVNLARPDILINSEEFKIEYDLDHVENVLISEEGRILICYSKVESINLVIGEVNLEQASFKDMMTFDLSQTPEELYSIGQSLVAGRKEGDYSTLFIWDLDHKKLRLQKKFSASAKIANNVDYELDPYFWSVVKVNEKTIAFLSTDIIAKEPTIIVYNWVEDCILVTCEILAEEILGFVNDELFVYLGEGFDYIDIETQYAKISLKGLLDSEKQETVEQVDFDPFGKVFMKFHKNCLDYLSSYKNTIALTGKLLPYNVLIMRKRNRKLEMLRFMKRELENIYHPYLIQDIVKMITE